VAALPIQRAQLLDFLVSKIDGCAAGEQSPIGIAIIDIRKFHSINRLFGFAAGEEVLSLVAHRLKGFSARPPLTMRVGSDEFAMVFSGLASAGLLPLIANKLLRLLGESFVVADNEITLDVNIGLAYQAVGAGRAEELYFRAEQGLRQAKASGDPFCFHVPKSDVRTAEDYLLEQELHEALHQNDFSLVYQPKLDLHTARIGHAEALLRWSSPSRGAIDPQRVVNLLEQSGRIATLTRWAINTALRESRDWPVDAATRSVAVNLSPGALREAELEHTVAAALNIWGQTPANLTLEITESVAMEYNESSRAQLAALKNLGVKISIDDFGTGYSSLSYFKHLPARELKIDKSFVSRLTEDQDDLRLVRHIVGLAHAFDMTVVAEGIEDRPTLELVRELGCDYAQGYYVSRPLAQGDYIAWLDNFDAGRFS
jgi:diguanylate cyclase (GGDEF)-like protein